MLVFGFAVADISIGKNDDLTFTIYHRHISLTKTDLNEGDTYSNDCPMESRIPIWLVVKGSVTIILMAILGSLSILTVLCGNRVGFKM